MIIKVKNGIGFDCANEKSVIALGNSYVHIMGWSDTVPNNVKIHWFYNNKNSSYESTSQYKFCISFFSDKDDQQNHVSVLTIK